MLPFAVPSLAAQPPTAEQIAGLDQVGGLDLSPDGAALVYTLTERTFVPAEEADDPGEWEVHTQLWLVRGVGPEPQAPRQLTTAEADASGPRFSPDGRAVAFLREREEKQRLHVLPLDGGEAVPVDTGELEPVQFDWIGPTAFAFTAPEPPTDTEEAEKERTGNVERFGREFRSHRLWRVEVGGKPVRVGTDDLHVAELDVSPDGTRAAVMTTASADPYEDVLRTPRVVDLATGSGRPLDAVPRSAVGVRWSPDSTKIAWLSTRETLTLHNALLVARADGGEPVDVVGKADATLDAFDWAGADAIVATVIDRTRIGLVRFDLDGGGNQRIPGVAGRTVLSGVEADASGKRVATLAQSAASPAEPAWIEVGTNTSGIAAHPVDVADWSLGPVEVVSWKGPGGAKIEGVLTLPPNAPSGPLPLMVFPHGGPDGVSLESFDGFSHFFAGRGFAVLRPNYRGGLGYGRDFYAANRGKLGEIEFGDIEAGVDALVKEGRADPARLVYGGWSWGGYLTAWTIGHTERYRAAFAGAAVVDTVSQYALSDINHGVAAQWEFMGDPWRDPQRFAKSNPLLSLYKARTPTLVAHGASDARVSPSASVILWRALTDVGCPTELLLFPDEPHGFDDRRHVVHLLDQWAAWYDRHLGGS